MISDEERRDVAEKMRGYDVSEFKESAIVPFLDCLGVGYLNWREVLDKLANLIDRPTCTIVHSWQEITPGLDELDPSDMCGFELSCGHEVQGYEKPKYCSKCGAVVVDED